VPTANAQIDLVRVVRETVQACRAAALGTEITCEVPETATVSAQPQIEQAIHETIANAVEHGGDEPTVRVVVRHLAGNDGSDWFEIEIRGDGPGILAAERAPITGDIEGPLRHA
jgi:signal transduction histidine kinase